jgi:hypothetical protein
MVLAMDRALVPLIGRGLRRDQFGDADQIVGDQVEQEIGSNGGDAAVLGQGWKFVAWQSTPLAA